jgi:Flp pilus assembly protein TadD
MGSTVVRSPRSHVSRPAAPPLERKPSGWPYALATVALVAIAVIVYSPGLRGAFIFDDRTLPFRLRGFGPDLWAWLQGVRPILMMSYWLDYVISGGRDPFSYHVFNLVIHLGSSGLIFVIARELLIRLGVARMRNMLAGFAAALFLLHPIQTEAVTYITGRSDILSAFFLFAAYAVFLRYGRERASLKGSAVVVLLFGIACLTKENAAGFLAVLLFTDLYFTRGGLKAIVRKSWPLYTMLAACCAAGLVIVWHVLNGAPTAGFGLRDLRWYEYLFTQWRVVWRYLGLFVLPVNQNIDHDVAISRTFLDHGAVFYLIALGALTVVLWMYRRKFPLVFFGFVTALLLLAPTSSFIPIRDVEVERRMYLPMLGLVLVAMDLMRVLAADRRKFAYASAAVLALSAMLTYNRNGLWRSGVTIWADAAAKSPRKARTRMHYGYVLLNARRCGDAQREFQAASTLGPPSYELYVDWAFASECLNDTQGAVAKLRAAAALEPRAHAYSQIARIYITKGLYDDALRALEQAEKIDPAFSLTYVYRGLAHSRLRQFQNAIVDFQRALQLDPSDATAQQGLAAAEAQFTADRSRVAPAAR